MEFTQTHTFNPQLIKEEQNKEKRNLEQFLNDQSNHNKKIIEKRKLAIEDIKKRKMRK